MFYIYPTPLFYILAGRISNSPGLLPGCEDYYLDQVEELDYDATQEWGDYFQQYQ